MKIMQVFTFDVSDKYAYFCDISNILKQTIRFKLYWKLIKVSSALIRRKKKEREKELNEKIGPVMPF